MLINCLIEKFKYKLYFKLIIFFLKILVDLKLKKAELDKNEEVPTFNERLVWLKKEKYYLKKIEDLEKKVCLYLILFYSCF